ncbi:hypothetical protein SKAU_G00414370 [Synaphobranchus kaupii]|uniref:Uncharacterized protein n=1 Tax=Synaphobranchus kaupii TaxID=118154 RepID=A0A9Q1E741_SYNKA|nr:hypothetical protein SKAU_G00414370 [Synaphobranchus kaupii]
MMNCQPHFSEKGTSKERTERKMINFLQDFLQEIEMPDGETDNAAGDTEPLAVPHVLQWMTGQSHIPILPDEKRHFKITCNFDHECRERLGDHSVCYPIRMIIPSFNEGVKVGPDSRDKYVVHTKEMNHIRDIKQTVLLQRVKNIMLPQSWSTPTPSYSFPRRLLLRLFPTLASRFYPGLSACPQASAPIPNS